MWATGRSNNAAGFSLLELLVVLVVVSVLLLLVVVGLPKNGSIRGVDADVVQLRSHLSKAADHAVFRGTHVGLVLTPNRYRFLFMDAAGRWRPVQTNGLGGEYMLAGGTVMLWIDGRHVALEWATLAGDGGGNTGRPLLMADDLGDWPSFELRFVRADRHFRITGGGDQALRVESGS